MTTLEIIVYTALGVLFLATTVSLVIYHPNYSWKQILKKPWLLFDVFRHAGQQLKQRLDDAQQTVIDVKESADKTIESISDVKRMIEEVRSEFKTAIQGTVDKEEAIAAEVKQISEKIDKITKE